MKYGKDWIWKRISSRHWVSHSISIYINREFFSCLYSCFTSLSADILKMNYFHVSGLSCFDMVIHLCSHVSKLLAFSLHDYFRMVAHWWFHIFKYYDLTCPTVDDFTYSTVDDFACSTIDDFIYSNIYDFMASCLFLPLSLPYLLLSIFSTIMYPQNISRDENWYLVWIQCQHEEILLWHMF